MYRMFEHLQWGKKNTFPIEERLVRNGSVGRMAFAQSFSEVAAHYFKVAAEALPTS